MKLVELTAEVYREGKMVGETVVEGEAMMPLVRQAMSNLIRTRAVDPFHFGSWDHMEITVTRS